MEGTYLDDNRPARPVFLKVLCILTFICTGLNLFFLLLALLGGSPSVEEVEKQETQLLESISVMRENGMDSFAQFMEQMAAMNAYTSEMFYTMLLVNILTAALGLFGAIFMWQGKKIGFHMYIIYSLAAVATIYIAVPVNVVPVIVPVSNLIVSGIFVFMYSRNLKWLR